MQLVCIPPVQLYNRRWNAPPPVTRKALTLLWNWRNFNLRHRSHGRDATDDNDPNRDADKYYALPKLWHTPHAIPALSLSQLKVPPSNPSTGLVQSEDRLARPRLDLRKAEPTPHHFGSGPGGPPGTPGGGMIGVELGSGTGAGFTISGSTPGGGLITPPLASNLSLRFLSWSSATLPPCVPPGRNSVSSIVHLFL